MNARTTTAARWLSGLLTAAAALLICPVPVGAVDSAEGETQLLSVVAVQSQSEQIVAAAAARWGVPYSLAWAIMWCESRGQPDAQSPYGHRGLYQFAWSTWAEQAPRYGYPADFAAAYDPVANAEVAMGMLAHGGHRHWASCTRWF